MCNRKRDRCLSDTARTKDRYQTVFFEKPDYIRNHIVTTNRLGEKRVVLKRSAAVCHDPDHSAPFLPENDSPEKLRP